jgi:SNF2 family DNA or RNA helicase
MADSVVFVDLPEGSDVITIQSDFWRKEQCKSIAGARWDEDRRMWTVPLSWAACLMLRGVFGGDLYIGPGLATWAWSTKTEVIDPLMELRDPTNFTTPGDDRLYPYQRAGTAWLKLAKAAILADEMGTGKTVQTAMAMEEIGDDAFPVLIVCPNTMKHVWKRELEVWCPSAKHITIVEGGAEAKKKAIAAAALEEHSVVIINYEYTWRVSRQAGYGQLALTRGEKTEGPLNKVPFRTVVLDEAHKIKNPSAQQTRACWWLGRMPTVKYRFALTGTPVANRPDDLWSLLNFIDHKAWPAKTRFVDRYCLQSWNGRGGMDIIGLNPDRQEEFHRVVDPFMRRVTKEMVLTQLPPIIRERRDCEMTPKQKKAYKDMETQMFVELAEEEHLSATTVIARLTRLIQFSSAYATAREVNGEIVVDLTDPSNKCDALEDLLEDLGDEPIVVFAMSKKLIMLAHDRLVKKGIECRLITGGQSPMEREGNIQDFQNGKARVILATVAAGGVGVTLTRAKTAVFLQRSWSMVDNTQAEARVHRIGSEKHDVVTIIDLVAPGTIEERMQQVMAMKKERLEEIVRDRDMLKRFLKGQLEG